MSGFFDDWRWTIFVIDATVPAVFRVRVRVEADAHALPDATRLESTSSTSPRAIITATSSVSRTFSARQALSPIFFFCPVAVG